MFRSESNQQLSQFLVLKLMNLAKSPNVNYNRLSESPEAKRCYIFDSVQFSAVHVYLRICCLFCLSSSSFLTVRLCFSLSLDVYVVPKCVCFLAACRSQHAFYITKTSLVLCIHRRKHTKHTHTNILE